MSRAIQDFYPEDVAHCFGCGRLNSHGHQLKSHWDADELVARYTPKPFHTAIPGFVYGGLIASLIDCHGTGAAAAVAARAAGWDLDGAAPPADEAPRFVTASLKVDYLKPTPLGPELELRARAIETGERKIVIQATLAAEGVVTARGQVVAVRMPESMMSL